MSYLPELGGFRVGLNNIKEMSEDGKAIENGNFNFVWANQWEPSTKEQHAFECYQVRFGDSNNVNEDISLIDKNTIPEHTLLCGGFPCQDYSVAHSLTKEKGIEGKKGVLWWQINDILKVKKPKFVLLENVDRLLKSPAKQRGRDFGIMLRCLNDNGYSAEWRVINAADYGHSQRRRRIYIFAARKGTKYYNNLKKRKYETTLQSKGIFSNTFKIEPINKKINIINIVDNYNDLVDVSEKLKADFKNSGFMINGNVYSVEVKPVEKEYTPLNKIVESGVDYHFYLNDDKLKKFEYLRGRKKIERTAPTGMKYFYAEGAMSPYDELNLPGRTMLTSEGSVNRSTHIIKDPKTDKIRILTPVECERLNEFPDNWTNTMNEKRRYFMMGNALVCGIINDLSSSINKIIDKEN